MPTLPAQSEWLSSKQSGKPAQIDRESNIIRGYVVAEAGVFKDRRGQFNKRSLSEIIELGNQAERGIKSRFTHPNLSDDGLGKHLGRAKNFRFHRNGKKVLADLHLNPTAMKEPPEGGRPLGEYIMELAETDPGSFSSSLVLQKEDEIKLDADGERVYDDVGPEPAIWHPIVLHASDVVDTGDAVDDFLSLSLGGVDEELPDAIVRKATQFLDAKFKNVDGPDAIRKRADAFLSRYCLNRFGDEVPEEPEDKEPDEMSDDKFQELSDQLGETNKRVDVLATAMTEFLDAQKEEKKKADELKARAIEIRSLCDLVGREDLAASLIADESLSMDDVRVKLKENRKKAPGDGSPGDDEKSGEAKLLQEYNAEARVHRRLGVTPEQYVEQRLAEKNAEPCEDIAGHPLSVTEDSCIIEFSEKDLLAPQGAA